MEIGVALGNSLGNDWNNHLTTRWKDALEGAKTDYHALNLPAVNAALAGSNPKDNMKILDEMQDVPTNLLMVKDQ